MAELKKYTSFEALKLAEKPSGINRNKDIIFSEFEAFLKQLQSKNSKKNKTKTENGKQSKRGLRKNKRLILKNHFSGINLKSLRLIFCLN